MMRTITLSLSKLLERHKAGHIPENARVSVTFEDDLPAPEVDPLLQLLQRWQEEDANLSPKECAEEERIFAELEKRFQK